jgi:hypothetical protein
MKDIPIIVPRKAKPDQIANAIVRAIGELSLIVTMRETLKKFPGSIHWHIKNGRERGTLEITYWPEEHRAWFTIQDGRKADWIEEKISLLDMAIRKNLKAGKERSS